METLMEILSAIVSLDREKTLTLLRKGLDEGIDPFLLLNEGITKGLKKIGDLFEEEKVFLPELIFGAKIVEEGLAVLKPHLTSQIEKKGEDRRDKTNRKFILGTVKGDVHDLGKNLVRLLFSISGYDVIDLGVDVSTEKFVNEVKKHKPDLLGLSSLMTTTMLMQKEVIEALKKDGLRDKVKVMIGGACITEKWSKNIGADAYATNVIEALNKAKLFFE